MTSTEAEALKKGDSLRCLQDKRTATVVAPARPKYVMIQWDDTNERNNVWIHHSEQQNLLTMEHFEVDHLAGAL